jgi:4-hydroxybenzoate polyprenyltransferase
MQRPIVIDTALCLCGTWGLIGVVLALWGVALTEKRHAGVGAYCIVVIGVAIVWRSIYVQSRKRSAGGSE